MATYLKRDTQGPCPDGWHIPTQADWQAVYDAGVALGQWSSSSGDGMKTKLKMPYTGYHPYSNPSVDSQGDFALLWSSSPKNPYASCLKVSSSYIYPNSSYGPANGLHIRPFKNSPLIPDGTWTTIYQGTGNAGIFWSSSEGAISISSNGSTWYTISDKNLGATTVYNDGDTLSQANCGNFYQWGNNYGFPYSGSVTTSSTRVDINSYGPGNYYYRSAFITVTSSAYNRGTDWNGNIWGGTTDLRPEEPVYSSTTITYKDNLGTTINTITSTTEPNWGESTIESYLNTIASGWKSYDGRKVLSIELGGSEKQLSDILDKSVLSSDGKIELILNYSEQLQYIKYISKLYHMGKEYLFDYDTPEPELPYLCFTANTAGSTVQLTKSGSPTTVNLETSTNGNDWTDYTIGNTILLGKVGDKVYMRNKSETVTGFSTSLNDYYTFKMSGAILSSGDTTTLLKREGLVADLTDSTTFVFCQLFKGCTSLITAPELPSEKLSGYCYRQMFYGCSSLTTAPELPGIFSADSAYSLMFSNCTSLTKAPSELKLRSIGDNQCYAMFLGCTALKIPPKMSPSIIYQEGCKWMFNDCTSLEQIPSLTATDFRASSCVQMFAGCSKIKISTTKTGEYQNTYRIPVSGTATADTSSSGKSFDTMFSSTGGTFTGTPTVNTTYYTSNTIV